MTFIAGPYTATFDGGDIGITTEGFDVELSALDEPIVGDNEGLTVQDGVFRGGDCFITMELEEWDLAKVQAAMWPWSDTWGKIGQVGTLHLSKAKVLVLTAVAGTTAALNPATLTATKLIMASNFPVRSAFATKLRRLPVRFRALPFVSGPDRFFFTTT